MKTTLFILGLIASSAFAQESALKDATGAIVKGAEAGRASTAASAVGVKATVSVADALTALYAQGSPSAADTAQFKSAISQFKLDANSNQTLSDAVDFTVLNNKCLSQGLEGAEFTHLANIVRQVVIEVKATGHTVKGITALAHTNNTLLATDIIGAKQQLARWGQMLVDAYRVEFPAKDPSEAPEKIGDLSDNCGVDQELGANARLAH